MNLLKDDPARSKAPLAIKNTPFVTCVVIIHLISLQKKIPFFDFTFKALIPK